MARVDAGKVMMGTRISKELLAMVDRAAKVMGTTRSQLVCLILERNVVELVAMHDALVAVASKKGLGRLKEIVAVAKKELKRRGVSSPWKQLEKKR